MNRLIILLTVPLILACGIQSAAMSADVALSTATVTVLNATQTPANVPSTSTATKTPTPMCTAVVTAERLNLRESNSETSPADYDGLVMGDVLSVKVVADGWLFVEAQDGRMGWVKGEFVTLATDCQISQ